MMHCTHVKKINPLNAELNPICHLLALAGAHHFVNVSRLGVKYIKNWVTLGEGHVSQYGVSLNLINMKLKYTFDGL